MPERRAGEPAADNRPIYGQRARFSGQSGVITFTTERPRRHLAAGRRVARESAAVAASAAAGATPRQSMAYGKPGALAISSGFGLRLHPILGIARQHRGVDLAAPAGAPIFAPSSGMVGQAGWSGGYGIALSLEHGGGIETRYGHLSRLNVVPGQTVRAGDVIGFVGSTGLSTGAHLHYEVRINGQAVNPLPARR
jgi:murein DD-endopeptidase MepM/ murein hydrolase activator NlpD